MKYETNTQNTLIYTMHNELHGAFIVTPTINNINNTRMFLTERMQYKIRIPFSEVSCD